MVGNLTSDARNVYLNASMSASGLGLNASQTQVFNTLNSYFNATGSLPFALASLTPQGLTQASGAVTTGSQQSTVAAMTQFMSRLDPTSRSGGAATTPVVMGYAEDDGDKRTNAFAMFGKAPPAVASEPRWSVWAEAYGGAEKISGDQADTNTTLYGTVVGADYRFSPDTLAGFALSGGQTSFTVGNLSSGQSQLFQAGAYARHAEGAAYVSGSLSYGWQDMTINRFVQGGAHLNAEFDANSWSGRLESGYRFVAPVAGGVGVTPYAAGQVTVFDLPAYMESAVSGSSAFALSYAAQDVTDPRSELGFRLDKPFATEDGVLTLRGRLAWAHDFDTSRSVTATFQSLPGQSFVVNGAAQAADSALTTISLEKKWTNGWSAAATFEGEFSRTTESYVGKGLVKYQF
jgi:uncharacterized protein with beta-barrel porin domain